MILGKLTRAGQSLSLVALPAFVWFSTRLFASIRTALNAIYDVSIRPPKGNFLIRFLLNKLRDLGMVLLTLVFFLANVLLTIGLSLLQSYFENRGRPGTDAVISTLEQWLAYGLGYLFLIVLFFFLYRHASLRRVRAPAALVASVFMAFAFEVAKQLYALYLRGATGYGAATLDASIGAMLLFVVWLYYSALVFLLGAVVAETWDAGRCSGSNAGDCVTAGNRQQAAGNRQQAAGSRLVAEPPRLRSHVSISRLTSHDRVYAHRSASRPRTGRLHSLRPGRL